MKFIAHKRETDGEEQLLLEHLTATKDLAENFAKYFNASTFAGSCALLHDVGKYSLEFQNRIKNNGKKCDHSTAGARIAYNLSLYGKIAAYCIAGHHSGLLDSGTIDDCADEGTLYSRLSNDYSIKSYDNFKYEMNENDFNFNCPNLKCNLSNIGFVYSFYTRMIYSCLTDADFLDTEKFMLNNEREKIDYNLIEMLEKLEVKLSRFNDNSLINKKRKEILNECKSKANSPRGIFKLTVPTGGGKTLSSMEFSMKHAVANDIRRIIYVIPYTSIIEQNAKVFSDIFSSKYILEHHSNYDFENDENDCKNIKRLASENWDMPIIVTTNVQFFESFFSNKSSKCRKLHNVSNSIIIFDEVQMLPINYLKPCIEVILELVRNYNCSVVLCSATQPALEPFLDNKLGYTDIIENVSSLYDFFKRTSIEYRGELSNNLLACEMNKYNQCLTIVNTKKHALELYKLLDKENSFHLSTYMCPLHRKKILEEIKYRLQNNLPCRVVSTQLIEAGVDVDFPIVYRSIAGIDSIIQSAGRCNREGKLIDSDGKKVLGKVVVFKPEEVYFKNQPDEIKNQIDITFEVMRNNEDISSLEAISDYFKKRYFYKQDIGLDNKKIIERLNRGLSQNANSKESMLNYDFKSIAKDFKIIEENTVPVIIPYDDNAIKLIEKLDYVDELKYILRSLQPYTVNLRRYEFDALVNLNEIRQYGNEISVLLINRINENENYDKNTGVVIKLEGGNAIFS